MTAMLHQPASFRFSTHALPPRDRRKALNHLRDRGVLPIEPLPDRQLHLDIAKWFLPGLAILSGSMTGIRQEGTPASGSDDLFFGMNVAGGGRVRQRDREVRPGAGDAFLVDVAAGAFAIARPSATQFIGLRGAALAPLVRDAGDESVRLIPCTNAALLLLASYLRALLSGDVVSSPEASRLVVTHVHDLIALSLGANGYASARAEQCSIPAARLQAIKTDIVANLEDGALTIGAVAARHGVTSRYVHYLFEREGITYTQFVLRQRLECAYRMLRDPRLAGSSITAIAYGVGFGDLSYFNRMFRRQYRRTPSEVRTSRA